MVRIFQGLTVTMIVVMGLLVNNSVEAARSVKLTLAASPTVLNCAVQENVLIELKDKYKDHIDISVVFMIKEKDGAYVSPFGKNDYEEALRQMIIQKHYPEKYWHYLNYRNTSLYNPIWENSAKAAGLDISQVTEKVKSTDQKEIWRDTVRYFKKYPAKEVPTLIVDGNVFSEGNAGLPELDSYIARKLGTQVAVQQVDIIIDPDARQPVKQEYERYLNRYISGVSMQVVPVDAEIKQAMLKRKISCLPIAVSNKHFINSYYKNYMPDNIVQLDGDYVLPITELKDSIIDRPLKKGRIKIYMQAHCGYASEFLLQLINKFGGGNSEMVLDYPGFMILEKNGNFSALHGKEELEESLRQYVIIKHYPEKYWKYASVLYKGDKLNWKKALEKSGLKVRKIKREIKENGQNYLQAIYEESENLVLIKSPTVIVDNCYIINDANSYMKKYEIKTKGHCQ